MEERVSRANRRVSSLLAKGRDHAPTLVVVWSLVLHASAIMLLSALGRLLVRGAVMKGYWMR